MGAASLTMDDIKLTWLSPENVKVERFKMETPEGYLIGNIGFGRSLADMFGPEHNTARYEFLSSLKKPSAWLDELKVKPEARGRGIGSKILMAAIQYMDESGIRYVVLSPRPETPDDKKRLDRFYRRFGFETVDKQGLWWTLFILDLDNPKARRKLRLPT